jgi:16S rRNA (guanine966-N2)-methyltransferase
MRVIAGSARHINLQTPEGMHTRPTLDRTKETLFNIIRDDCRNAVFIDLFAGSGGIGIEALSEGARKAYFVDNDKSAIRCINANLSKTSLLDRAVVYDKDVFVALTTIQSIGVQPDIIFMDPPFGRLFEREVLQYLCKCSMIVENILIIVESDMQTSFEYLDQIGLCATREKTYRTHKHTFIKCALTAHGDL